MNYLYEATKTWTNTNEMLVDEFDNDAGSKFDMQLYNTYARLPYYNEVSDVSTKKMWLINYLNGVWDENEGIVGRENRIDEIDAYWTLSSYADAEFSTNAWVVRYDAVVYHLEVVNGNSKGVRPVINLKI